MNMYHLDDSYRNPVNNRNTEKLSNELFLKGLTDLYLNANQKGRTSAGKKQYGPGVLPEFARFRAALYFEGFLKGAHNKFPSYDDYNKYQDKVKTVVHDEYTGLDKLRTMCEKQAFKKKYTSMVIYAAPHELRPVYKSADYFYMVNIYVPRDGVWIWRHPWKELILNNGYFDYERTKAANVGFNELGYLKYNVRAQQNINFSRPS